ncbi:hypothetical protein AVEN_195893-1 [Araneus ventricosus]|uniref:Uncharacterized protein n=1 Tax=Araneus ventricosus TaxID=182803 RepID=A0A4Y2DU03_ARAVE|nr:hypothetical protein AVEN_195893-1 [Araneus ventricosus]
MYGIHTQTPHEVEPVQIWSPSQLVKTNIAQFLNSIWSFPVLLVTWDSGPSRRFGLYIQTRSPSLNGTVAWSRNELFIPFTGQFNSPLANDTLPNAAPPSFHVLNRQEGAYLVVQREYHRANVALGPQTAFPLESTVTSRWFRDSIGQEEEYKGTSQSAWSLNK